MTGYVSAGQRVRMRVAMATPADSNQSTVPIQGRVAGESMPSPAPALTGEFHFQVAVHVCVPGASSE